MVRVVELDKLGAGSARALKDIGGVGQSGDKPPLFGAALDMYRKAVARRKEEDKARRAAKAAAEEALRTYDRGCVAVSVPVCGTMCGCVCVAVCVAVCVWLCVAVCGAV